MKLKEKQIKNQICQYYFTHYSLYSDQSQSINVEATSTLRRTLLGYRLEINFEECIFLSPSVTSYVYKHPRPGQTYAFMLSAVTCASENAKEHRLKVYKVLHCVSFCLNPNHSSLSDLIFRRT